MKKNILELLNEKKTHSCFFLDKILSEESYLNFMQCFQRNDFFHATSKNEFCGLFSVDSLVELLNTRRLSFPRSRLVKNGCLIEPVKYNIRKSGSLGETINRLDVEKVSHFLECGATLAIDFSEDLWGAVNELCNDFSQVFNERTGATVFFSSGKDVGFTSHWDNSDVIVYQLSGKKRWKIFHKTLDMPVEENKPSMTSPPGEPFFDEIVNENEILYIPRGFWHAPEPCGEHSLHISFAFRRRNGMDYIKWLTPKLSENLVFRKDIDRFADDKSTLDYINNLRMAMNQEINLTNLLEYISDCDRRQLCELRFDHKNLIKS